VPGIQKLGVYPRCHDDGFRGRVPARELGQQLALALRQSGREENIGAEGRLDPVLPRQLERSVRSSEHLQRPSILIVDDDGDWKTTCVVERCDSLASGKAKGGTKRAKLSVPANVSLQSLTKAIGDDGGTTKPTSNHVPVNQPMTTLENWRRYHYRRVRDDTPEVRKKAFQRAPAELQAKEVIGMWGPEEGSDKDVIVWTLN
jgi:hypothetical protein